MEMIMPRRFTGALVIAVMAAASLHLTAKPASADTISMCAQLQAIIINIENSSAPEDAKFLAIEAVRGAKRFAGCGD
jgi:hypothetical protein